MNGTRGVLQQIVLEVMHNKEFIKNYDRLRGTNLSLTGSPIELEIDFSSGRMEKEVEGLCRFVMEEIIPRMQEFK